MKALRLKNRRAFCFIPRLATKKRIQDNKQPVYRIYLLKMLFIFTFALNKIHYIYVSVSLIFSYTYYLSNNMVPDFNLKIFQPISLEDMNQVKLLDRMDKKFMFDSKIFDKVLESAAENYFILEIAEKRYAAYETTYMDTPDYEMYTLHHNGKLNRYKVRFRTYVDSGLNFFEIKFKTNKGRTKKSRIQQSEKDLSITGDKALLLEHKSIYKSDSLVPAIQVNYNRITLVNKNMTERITLDFDLNFKTEGNSTKYPRLIIAEVKQDKSGSSPFIDIMQQLKVRDVSISKYCLGIASLVKNIKTNNFKTKIRYVNHLFSESA